MIDERIKERIGQVAKGMLYGDSWICSFCARKNRPSEDACKDCYKPRWEQLGLREGRDASLQ